MYSAGEEGLGIVLDLLAMRSWNSRVPRGRWGHVAFRNSETTRKRLQKIRSQLRNAVPGIAGLLRQVALALAAIGIYGVMAYSVAQRTQEMSIRMAVGADRDAIRRLVVWHGMRLAIAGVVLGIAAALELTRLIASFLFRRQLMGFGGVPRCASHPHLCGAARRLATCDARIQSRPNARLANGVIWVPAAHLK